MVSISPGLRYAVYFFVLDSIPHHLPGYLPFRTSAKGTTPETLRLKDGSYLLLMVLAPQTMTAEKRARRPTRTPQPRTSSDQGPRGRPRQYRRQRRRRRHTTRTAKGAESWLGDRSSTTLNSWSSNTRLLNAWLTGTEGSANGARASQLRQRAHLESGLQPAGTTAKRRDSPRSEPSETASSEVHQGQRSVLLYPKASPGDSTPPAEEEGASPGHRLCRSTPSRGA